MAFSAEALSSLKRTLNQMYILIYIYTIKDLVQICYITQLIFSI